MPTQTETIQTYITLLMKEYDFGELTERDFLDVWLKHVQSTAAPPEESKTSPEESKPDEYTYASLKGLKKAQLQEICTAKGLNTKGTKQMLTDRILGVPSSAKQKTKTKGNVVSQVLQTIQNKKEQVCIRRNLYNRYEHVETKLVFDDVSKKVIGKQEDNGTVSPLTEKDIETCQLYEFEYQIPEHIA